MQKQFFATAAKGMESLLASELAELGAEKIEAKRSGVAFEGGLEVAYRACLWSRIANRVLLPLATFHARTPEELYRGVQKIHWWEHLSPSETLAVDFSATSSHITHSQFGALKTKDAIVDQFRAKTGERPSVNVERPDIRVNVYLNRNEATVSLDLSGESLHLRGYREEGARAPLKENLAAAILRIAKWPEVAARGEAFLDPMCGSGTLALEAALIAADVAPGLKREHWGFEGWKRHNPKLWERVHADAKKRAEEGMARKLPTIVGYDRDPRAVRAALANVERAGLRGKVHFEKREFAQAEPVAPAGIVVVNPPYGERLGEVEELKPLYKGIGDAFKQRFKGWRGFVFTGSPELSKVIGLKAARRHPLFNGPIECRLFEFDLY